MENMNTRKRRSGIEQFDVTQVNKDAISALVEPIAMRKFGSGSQLQEPEIESVQRSVFRCTFKVASSQNNGEITWPVVVKAFQNPILGKRAFALMQELWDKGFAEDAEDKISIARPLGYDPEFNWLVMEALPGRRVNKLLEQPQAEFYVQQAARALAKLHHCPVVPDKMITLSDQIQRCDPSYHQIAEAFPDLKDTVYFMVDTLRGKEAGLEACELAPVHGDFHFGQVHVEGDRVWLIDLSGLKYGDPASDVGNLLALLYGKNFRISQYQKYAKIFLCEYLKHTNQEASLRQRIALYQSASLLRRACKHFRQHKQKGKKNIEWLLEQGMQVLKEMML
ncbi:MAG: aminoglycoside phosphotransferase family protein [Calditrichaeota bacterium]|nr:MAG: aminoglycoside phosphotransferase family protein [Calditrichota bacterium]